MSVTQSFAKELAKDGAKALVKGFGKQFGGAIGGAMGNALLGALGLGGDGQQTEVLAGLKNITGQLADIKGELSDIENQLRLITTLIKELAWKEEERADYDKWLTVDKSISSHLSSVHSQWTNMHDLFGEKENAPQHEVDAWADEISAGSASSRFNIEAINRALVGTAGANDALMHLWSKVLINLIKDVKFPDNFQGVGPIPNVPLNHLVAFDYYIDYFRQLSAAQLKAAVMLKAAYASKALKEYKAHGDSPTYKGYIDLANKSFTEYLQTMESQEAVLFAPLGGIVEAYAVQPGLAGLDFAVYNFAADYLHAVERTVSCPPELLHAHFESSPDSGKVDHQSQYPGYAYEVAEQIYADHLPRRSHDTPGKPMGRVVVHQIEYIGPDYVTPELAGAPAFDGTPLDINLFFGRKTSIPADTERAHPTFVNLIGAKRGKS